MHEDALVLQETLDLEPFGDDRFAPRHYPRRDAPFIFGGQLLAQAVKAASMTVDGDDRVVHSVHARFLAAGRPADDTVFVVGRVRDGGSFNTRSVAALHGDLTYFAATLGFNRLRPGDDEGRQPAEYQLPIPAAPGPDDDVAWSPYFGTTSIFGALDLREFPVPPRDADGLQPFSRRVWFRVRETWPHDRTMQSCAFAFCSDLGVTTASSVTEGLYPDAPVLTSLDHAVWFHRLSDPHEWHLLDLVSVSNSASRGLVRGTVHHIDGTLVASLTQETLIR